MGPKLALALLALAAGGMAACGDTQEDAPPLTVGAPAAKAPAESPPSDPGRSCDAQGIDTRRLREGTCTNGSVQYVVVNREGSLRLESLAVTVAEISAERELEGRDGPLEARKGAFLRLTLEVRNRREYPQRFEVGQTILGVGDQTFGEAEEAEQAYAGAIATIGEGRIEPGGTLRGDVLFDVPAAVVGRVSRTGRFFVANFGETPEGAQSTTVEEAEAQIREIVPGQQSVSTATELGQMRLYAAAGAGR